MGANKAASKKIVCTIIDKSAYFDKAGLKQNERSLRSNYLIFFSVDSFPLLAVIAFFEKTSIVLLPLSTRIYKLNLSDFQSPYRRIFLDSAPNVRAITNANHSPEADYKGEKIAANRLKKQISCKRNIA